MRLKARRGAVVVLVGIMIVSLISISAISIDFSRLWSLRNELQTAADAAAHAGAVQLSPPNNAGLTDSVARAFAAKNPAMTRAVTVDSVVQGDWDDINRVFIAPPANTTTDAVSVVVSRVSSGLIMRMLGIGPPRLKARAIGWAEAPVASSNGCIKPVAIPMVQLMWRVNLKRGIANTPDTLGMYRKWDPVNDMAALNSMTAAERTFSLKIGSGQLADTLGSMPGSYQAVQLGPLRDANGVPYSPGPDNRGVAAFTDHMSGVTCYTLKVGDILQTQSGLGQGQSAICGAWPGAQGCGSVSNYGPGICSMIRGDQQDPSGTPQSSTDFGNCEDNAGNVGVGMKAAFYRCMVACNGKTEVEVSMLGSFSLTKVFPDDSKKGAYTTFDKAQIQGIFTPMSDPGTVGPGQTTLFTIILVK